MKRKILLMTIIIFVCSTAIIFAGGNKDRYIERGVFSIIVPENWEIVSINEMKYKLLRGTMNNNFAPNINFADEAYSGNFDDYLENFMDQLDSIFEGNLEYILFSDFATHKDLKGKVIVITTFQQERLIQFNFFCFPMNDDRYFIITGTNLASESARYSELFVNTVRTFEWLK